MKLIFFDIDGTIIDEETKEMSESTRGAIEQARKNGHICVINTGRTWRLVNGTITGLTEFDGYILGCGTMIIYHDKVLMHETFSEETAKRIVTGLRKYKVDALLEGCDNNFHDDLQKINTKLFYDFVTRFYGKISAALIPQQDSLISSMHMWRIKPIWRLFTGNLPESLIL